MPIVRSHGYLRESFAVAHRLRGAVGTTGVLLLPPLGYEDVSAYRPLRGLADALAEGGRLVLRLDWPGLGDSAGDALDADLHHRRLETVRSGVAALRTHGCRAVVGIAVRAGGLLALEAGGFDELVLWGTPRSGARFLHEERLFQRLAVASFGAGAPPPPPGAEEAGGFLHGPSVIAAMSAFDPTTAVHTGLRRALLIGRDGAAPDSALAAGMRAGGVDVEERRGEGLGALLENAYNATLVAPIREAVLTWVGGSGAEEARHQPVRESQGSAVRLETHLQLDAAVERPWREVGGAGALSGVVCEPVGGVRPGMAWTVFYNAGGIRRCGPNRLWTTAARALAAAGRPSLRVDVRDVGDSDGRSEPAADLEAMYAPSSIDDAVRAFDWVVDQGAGSVNVVGLCSGAFLGAQVSVRRSVRRAVLFNGLAFVWDDDARASSMTSQVRGSLFDARRWRRLLTGKIDAFALARAMVNKGRLRVQRWRSGAPGPDPVAALLGEIRARGTDLQLVSSAGDPSIAYMEGHVNEGERPPLTLLEGADHTIRPTGLHGRVVALILGQSQRD